MLPRFLEKVIMLLEQLAQALIDLLKVGSDEVKSQIVRWILVALTSMVVVAILALAFLLSLFLAGIEGISAKLHLIGNYFVVGTSALAAAGSSFWAALKFWRKFFPTKDKPQNRKTLLEGHHRLATGDEETDRGILRHAIMDLLESLGEDVSSNTRGNWTLFVRGSQVFARLYDAPDGPPLEIHAALILTRSEKQKLASIDGLRSNLKNPAGNVCLTVFRLGDLHRFQPWLEKAHAQADKA